MEKIRVLWNLIHPNILESHANRIIFDKIKELENVTVNNLYEKYPDFQIDVKKEQNLLVTHDMIVFQHPFYWYSAPALFKEWQDKVLEFGFAYPPSIGKALHGKNWLTVMTTGGPEEGYRSGGYNNFTISELMRPFQQAAYLCGMRWHAPVVVHNSLPESDNELSEEKRAELTQVGDQLVEFITEFDSEKRHSIEPVIALHSLK